MTDYPIDMQLVVDAVSLNVVANGQVYIYDTTDTGNVAPLALTDTSGLPLSQPLMSSNNGFIPAFRSSSPQVKWVGGGFTGYFDSYAGLRDVALDAVSKIDSFSVGTVETGEAGTDASATISGDAVKQINLVIPRGPQGPAGAAGNSNIALDEDGVPYFVSGSNAVQILADTDGRPYFI